MRADHGKGKGFVFESEILINAARQGTRIAALPIPALYGCTTRRRSQFRPLVDIYGIAIMVAGKLLSRRMYLEGLFAVTRAGRSAKSRRWGTPKSAQKDRGLAVEQRGFGAPK